MTTFVPPYTATVTSTAGGMSKCTYVDGNGVALPQGAVLTTTTPEGQEGELTINFTEAKVGGKNLRLVGAAVKTVGNDPTMNAYNYLTAERNQSGSVWIDSIVVPWSVDTYTRRGVVLLFAQVSSSGDMLNFYPSSDPQTQNDQPQACD